MNETQNLNELDIKDLKALQKELRNKLSKVSKIINNNDKTKFIMEMSLAQMEKLEKYAEKHRLFKTQVIRDLIDSLTIE